MQQQLFTGGINTPQHALIQVNADITNFYIGPSGGIGANEVDFYTVILHEALHTLGFGSQITPTGAPNQGFYTLWDLNLRKPAGDFMINATPGGSGPCCAEYEFNSDDFPNMPDIIWDQDCGPNNVQFDVALLPPVNGEYNPANQDVSTFMNVLSHLDRDCPGGEHYVMHSGVPDGPDGVQRTLTATEMSILCKLGYDTDDCDPDCIAVAGDDGNFFVGLNQNINIDFSTLLSNDFPSDATFTYKPDCGNHNGLSITPGGTFVNVLGTAIGAYTFCYSITSCDGKRCDVGTVRVVVTNPAIVEACQHLEPCQINPFWDFELFGSPDEMYPLLTLGDGNGMGDGVPGTGFTFYDSGFQFDNTPDLWTNPILLNNQRTCGSGNLNGINVPFGNQCLGMIVRNIDGANWPEGAAFPLCEPIFPGMSGTIKFYAMTPEACTGTGTPQVQARLEFSELPPVDQALVYNNPGMSSGSAWLVDITSTQNTNPVFAEYLVQFTNTSTVCWNYLYLSGVSANPTIPGDFGYLLVDNVRVELQNNLTDVLDVNTSAGPASPCLGDIVTLQIEICNNVACLPNTFSNPEFLITGMLTPGLTFVPNSDFPTLSHLVQSDGIPYGECLTLELTAQVGGDLSLVGQLLNINLSFDAHDDCYDDFTIVGGGVTPILCTSAFTCPCDSVGLNIDASEDSQYYDPILGGTPYSALEAAFDYDQDNDGVIGPLEHHNCIAILGNLIIDQNLVILSCDNVQMQPCSEITVGTNAVHSTMDLANNTIYSCDIMWHGITVTPFAALNFKGNTIRDAQFANTAVGGFGFPGGSPTKLIAVGNTYSNNHVGVLFPSQGIVNIEHLPFSGNTFNTIFGQTLKPPCDANLPNYSATQGGYAGAVTLGAPMTVGTPGDSGLVNTFQLLRNGVIADGAHLNVYRADFQRISGNGVGANGGNTTVLNCNFNIVRTGVFGRNNWQLTVRNNTMTAMWRGVEALGAHGTDISDNPSIGFANRGILCRELVPAGPFFGAHRIANNTNMFISPFPGIVDTPFPPFPAAIEIDNAMSIDVGSARITNNHFFSGGFLNAGIRVNGSGGWDIDENHIDFQNPTWANFSNPGIGIQLTNTHENYLYHNTVSDLDATSRSSTGLSLSIGTGNRYCCNITHGSRFGSRFLGACDDTEWRVTDMLNHEFALFCDAGTMIDPQPSYGNDFNLTSGIAFHGGDFGQVSNSRFEVLDMFQPNWPEAIVVPNTNAQFFDDNGSDADCVAPCTAPQFAPPPPDRDIDVSDLTTASGGFSSGPYGATLQWENERRLYERMSDYQGMIGANAVTDAFYATANYGKVGAYYQTEYSAKGIYDYPASIADGLETSAAQLEANRLAVEAILAGLAQAQNATDSALIYQNANTLYQSGQAAAEALTNYQMQAQAFSSAEAFDAYVATNALPADNIREQNRKTVQRLYLQTVGMGIAHLNPEQLAEAEAIAIQCPLEGGSAVYAARALYRLNIDRVFVDDSLCIPSQERQGTLGKQTDVEGLSLVPNPANELVTIKGLSLSKEQPVEVSLLDLNGKICANRFFETGEAMLSTTGLQEGVYVCQVKVRGTPPVALKLVVVH